MFVGHRIDSVSLERGKSPEDISEFSRNYDFNIEERKLESTSIGNKKLKVLRICYSFSINYTEDVGAIRIKGAIDYEGTEKRLKELDSNWDKEADFQTTVFNFIFANAIPLILDLSRHIGLPSPVPLPILTRDDVKK